MAQKKAPKEHFVPIQIIIPKNELVFILQIIEDITDTHFSETNIFFKLKSTEPMLKVSINTIYPDTRKAILNMLKNKGIEDSFSILVKKIQNKLH